MGLVVSVLLAGVGNPHTGGRLVIYTFYTNFILWEHNGVCRVKAGYTEFYLITGDLSLEMLKLVILYKYHLSEINRFLFSIVQIKCRSLFLCLLLVFTDGP